MTQLVSQEGLGSMELITLTLKWILQELGYEGMD